jgi:hypothetical protein
LKRIGLIILLSIFGQRSLAQVDTTTNFSLVINTKWNPVLTSAKKIVIRPVIEPLSSKLPNFTYDLPNFGYKVLPTYQPARAIDLKRDGPSDLVGNYFKLGGGNFLTPYGEFQIHSVRDKKFSYGAYGKHLSANAGKPNNADFSDNELGIFGSKMTRKGDLTGKLNYENHVVHRYGYNRDSFDFEKKSIAQKYNDFNGSVSFDNGTIRKKSGYRTGFNFYTFSNGLSRENDFVLSLLTDYSIRKKQALTLNASVDFTNLIRDTLTLNRTFVRLLPQYHFSYKKIDIAIGANGVFYIDSAGSKPYVFPAVTAEHFIVKDKVKVFAGVGGDVKKTSMRQLSYLNPFVIDSAEIVNAVSSFNAHGGMRGIIKKKIDYLLKVSFSNDNNMPLYVSDSSGTRPFRVVYDNVQTVAFQTGLGLRVDEQFFIQFATTFYNYKTDREDQAWQLPAFDIDLNLRYTLAKKLQLRAQLYALGERFQKDLNEVQSTRKLKPFLDVNLMADYRYKKNISFFLNVNNISNARYQKWYNYPSFGMNVLAGVTFSL